MTGTRDLSITVEDIVRHMPADPSTSQLAAITAFVASDTILMMGGRQAGRSTVRRAIIAALEEAEKP